MLLMCATLATIAKYGSSWLETDSAALKVHSLVALIGSRVVWVDNVACEGLLAYIGTLRGHSGTAELTKMITMPHAVSAECRETGAAEILRPHGPMQLPLLSAFPGPTTSDVRTIDD